jgi:hypothetical protein
LLSDGVVVFRFQAAFHGLLGAIKRPFGVIERSLHGVTRLTPTACKQCGS